MPFPILGAITAGTGLAGLIGGLFGQRSQNRQRDDMISMAQQMIQQLRSQGISNPEQYLQSAIMPLLQNSQGLAGQIAPILGSTAGDMQRFYTDFLQQGIPQYSRPGDMNALYQTPLADAGRGYDDVLGALRANLFRNINDNPLNAGMDRAGEMASGQDQALAALLGVGNDLVDMRGNTGYNMNAQDAAGRAISGGGWDPHGESLFSRGQSLFDTGGMTPDLTRYSGMAAAGLPSLMRLDQGGYSGQDMMGPYGGMAANRLLSGPSNTSLPFALSNGMLNNSFASGMGMLTGTGIPERQMGQASLQPSYMGQIDSGWNPQNGMIGSMGAQGLQQLLNRNQELSDIIPFAQQAFSGNLPGGDQYGDLLQNLISQAVSTGSAGFGGGGGGAGAGYAAGLGPMQEDLAAMLTKGREFFEKDPLLSMEQMISMAVDQAGTQAAHQGEAARRYAAQRGGGAAIVGAGAANRAYGDFARQAGEMQAQAMRDAALKRQELGLQQQMQGGQIGIGAANADTNRQQAQIQANIANANNSTSASIANAQMAQQSAQAQAQLRMAALQAGMNAATAARGQNYGRSEAGLNSMLQVQNLANQRGQVFTPALIAALQDAQQRNATSAQTQLGDLISQRQTNLGDVQSRRQAYLGDIQSQRAGDVALAQARIGGAASLLPGILSADTNRMGQQAQFNLGMNQNDTARMLGLLQGSTTAGGNAANANTQMAQILAQLGLGANNTAANRIGMGLGAMGQAGQQAGNNLSTYGQIGNSASADQLARMGLGSNMLGQNLAGRQAGMGMLGNLFTAGQNGITGAGNLFNATQQGQSNIWQNLLGMDYNNRQLGMQGTTAGLSGLGGLLNGLTGALGTSYGPSNAFTSGLLGYMGGQQAGATGLMGGLFGMQGPQQNPWGNMFGSISQGLSQLGTMFPQQQQQQQQGGGYQQPTGIYSAPLPIPTNQSQMSPFGGMMPNWLSQYQQYTGYPGNSMNGGNMSQQYMPYMFPGGYGGFGGFGGF